MYYGFFSSIFEIACFSVLIIKEILSLRICEPFNFLNPEIFIHVKSKLSKIIVTFLKMLFKSFSKT